MLFFPQIGSYLAPKTHGNEVMWIAELRPLTSLKLPALSAGTKTAQLRRRAFSSGAICYSILSTSEEHYQRPCSRIPGKMASSQPGEATRLLHRAYDLNGSAANEKFYTEWASSYDTDLENLQYVSPQRSVEAVVENSKSREQLLKILDAGCGTGLVGECLAQSALSGKFTVDGLDLTAGMLETARAKGVYQELEVADLTKPIARSDGSYDVVMCVGTLTKGHVGPSVFKEFVRVAATGGLVVTTVHAEIWESGGYKSVVDTLATLAVVDIVSVDEFGIMKDSSQGGRMVILRKK